MGELSSVALLKDIREESAMLESCIRRKAATGATLQILEAGCGRRWPLDLSGIQFTLTGVDLNESALTVRRAEVRDLDEAIVGDLRTIDLGQNRFDVIYNSFVLEHIKNATVVLDNFVRWLKPGGILLLRIPDRDSVYGAVTRFTPFWFHVLLKRHVLRMPHAGEHERGYGPYPTYHEPVVSRQGIRAYCEDRGLAVAAEYGQPYYLNRRGVVGSAVRAFVRLVALMSLGTLEWRYNNLTYVLEKKTPGTAGHAGASE